MGRWLSFFFFRSGFSEGWNHYGVHVRIAGGAAASALTDLCHSGGRVTLFDAMSAPGRWTGNPDIVCLLPFCSALYLTFAVDAHIFAPF